MSIIVMPVEIASSKKKKEIASSQPIMAQFCHGFVLGAKSPVLLTSLVSHQLSFFLNTSLCHSSL